MKSKRIQGIWPLLFAFQAICVISWAGSPPGYENNELPSLAPMLEQATPAVVHIASHGNTKVRQSPFSGDPFFDMFFNFPERQQQRSVETQSLGSGVIVDAEKGLILTSNHVIANADRIVVTLRDKQKLDATVVGTDAETDVAVIRIESNNLKALKTANLNKLRVGDYVVAIGNPFGLGQTVTSGIVSALNRSGLQILGYENFIQTDASINQGNSGGALVNLRGELVGINTAILSKSGGNVGIGFAIPIDLALGIMKQLVETGKVERGFLGVMMQDLTPDIAKGLGVEKSQGGAIISKVIDGSPADKSGLQAGDIITEIDAKKISNASDMRNLIGLTKADKTARIKYLRDGKTRQTQVKIASSKKEVSAMGEKEIPDDRLKGLYLKSLDEGHPLAAQIRSGVVIVKVTPGSRAARAGLRDSDVITEVNRKKVASVKEFVRQIKRVDKRPIVLHILRGDGALYLVLN